LIYKIISCFDLAIRYHKNGSNIVNRNQRYLKITFI